MLRNKIGKVAVVCVMLMGIVALVGCGRTERQEVKLPVVKDSAKASEIVINERDEDTKTVDFGFYSSDKDKKIDSFPELIEIDGEKYSFTGETQYSVEEVIMSVCYEEDVNVRSTDEIESKHTFVSDQTGNEYELSLANTVSSSLMPVNIKVSEKVEYFNLPTKLSLPVSKKITYYNDVKCCDETIEGTLTECTTSEPRWVKGDPIAGLFAATDQSVYEWQLGENKVSVPLDASAPVWDGFERDIATSLGLTESNYRILSGRWIGDKFDKDGEIQRAAVYDYETLVMDEYGLYEGMGEAYGYKVHVSYVVPDNETQKVAKEDISKIYKIAVKAVYRKEAPETALFRLYKELNSDTVGVIEIPDSPLCHPLMCSPYDEDFYLTHDIYGALNSRGVPFTVACGNLTGRQYNTVIYGHNIKKGGVDVFGGLDCYLDEEYAKEHPYIYVTNDEGRLAYKVIAAYVTTPGDFAYSDTVYFLSEAIFKEYIGKVRTLSAIPVPSELTISDTYITLSTCAGEGGSKRTVVMARLENIEKK